MFNLPKSAPNFLRDKLLAKKLTQQCTLHELSQKQFIPSWRLLWPQSVSVLSQIRPYLQNIPALGIMPFLDLLWVLSSSHPFGSLVAFIPWKMARASLGDRQRAQKAPNAWGDLDPSWALHLGSWISLCDSTGTSPGSLKFLWTVTWRPALAFLQGVGVGLL